MTRAAAVLRLPGNGRNGHAVKPAISPDKLGSGRNYTPTGMYFQSRPGTIAMVEFDEGAFHRTQPITVEHAQAVLRRISGADLVNGNGALFDFNDPELSATLCVPRMYGAGVRYTFGK